MQMKSEDFSWFIIITVLSMLLTDASKHSIFSPCAGRDRCLSTWECRTLNGISVSVCLMGYVFGACCHLPVSDSTLAAPISVNSTQSLKRPEGFTSECPTNCTSPPGVIVEPSFTNEGTLKTTTILNVERDDHYFEYVTRHRPFVWTRRPTPLMQWNNNKLNANSQQSLSSLSGHGGNKIEINNHSTQSAIGSVTTVKTTPILGNLPYNSSSYGLNPDQSIRNQSFVLANKTEHKNHFPYYNNQNHYNYNHNHPSHTFVQHHHHHHHSNHQQEQKPSVFNNSVHSSLDKLQGSLSLQHGTVEENSQNSDTNFPEKHTYHHEHNNYQPKPTVVTRLPLGDFSKYPYFNFLPPRKPPKYQHLTTSAKSTVIAVVTDSPEEVNWNKVNNVNPGDYQQDPVQIISQEDSPTSSSFGLHFTTSVDSSIVNNDAASQPISFVHPSEHEYNKVTTASSRVPYKSTEQFKIPVTHFFHQLFVTSTPSVTLLGATRTVSTQKPPGTSSFFHPLATTSTSSISETTSAVTGTEIKITDYKKECGIRPLAFDGRVVGGSSSTFGQWPWQALVKEVAFLNFFSKNKCGGVLINRLFVLTAAHCRPGFFKTFTVILGEHDLTSDQEILPVIERNVRRVHAHPDFVVSTFENDIALLELEKPVEFELHIVPICLPAQGQDFTGKIGVASGFGKLSNGGRHATVLHHVSVPILSRRQCQEYFAASRYKVSVKDSYLCAGNKEGGKDSCEGDSGGPLAVERADGRWVLAGIVSNGIKCALPNSPGIYTKISDFVDWIKRKIS